MLIFRTTRRPHYATRPIEVGLCITKGGRSSQDLTRYKHKTQSICIKAEPANAFTPQDINCVWGICCEATLFFISPRWMKGSFNKCEHIAASVFLSLSPVAKTQWVCICSETGRETPCIKRHYTGPPSSHHCALFHSLFQLPVSLLEAFFLIQTENNTAWQQ